MKYIFISITFLIVGCKESSKESAAATTKVKTEVTEADLGNLYQYFHATPATLEQKDENELIEYAVNNNMKVERTHNGVYIAVNEKGSGSKVEYGEWLYANYTGKFLDGKVFDSSKKPMKFRQGQMIAGWTEALMSSQKGDKITILIPSHLAYGKRGFPGFVPPDANLVFDIEILDGQN